MKRSDLQLPPKIQGRIRAADALLTYCKTQMRNPDPNQVIGFAELSEILQVRITTLRKPTSLQTDNHEASAAVATVGGDHQ